MNNNSKFYYDEENINKVKEAGLYFFMKKIQSFSQDKVKIEGRNFINFTSSDYLGLANHPKIKEAAIKAIKKYGVGSGQTRIFGSIDIHDELENKLANFIGTEEIVLFSTGYMANLGTVSTIIKEGDFTVTDEYVHASIIDGCELSKGINVIFKHNDMSNLENVLLSLNSDMKLHKKLILVDSVYSMHGDIANLHGICRLKEKYNAILMIDDAHATGVLGENGGGAAGHFKLHDKIDFIMGSLGKSLGSLGGFVGGSRKMVSYLKHNARSFIFTTGLPPPITMATITAIDIIKNQPELRNKLLENAKFMRNELVRIGYNIGKTETQIIPIVIGDEFKMFKFVEKLCNFGIAVNPVTFPAVKTGASQIRICITSLHSRVNLERSLLCFEKTGKQMGLI